MRYLGVLALLATLAATASWPARAGAVIDQANYPLTNSDGNLEIHEANTEPSGGRHFVAQTFTVGRTGWLTRVDLPVKHHRCTPVGQLRVDIVWTVDGVPGDVVITGASVGPADVPVTEYGLVSFNFGADAVPVVAGDVLTIAVTTDAAYPCNYLWDGEFNGEFNEFNSDYAGGKTWCFYQLEYMTDACWRDMGFQTWVSDTQPGNDPPPDDPPPPPPPPPPPDDPPPPPPPPPDDDDGQGENDDAQGDNRDDQGGNRDDQRGNDDGHGQDGDHAGKAGQTPFAGAMEWKSLLLALMGAGLRRRRPCATR